MDILTHSLVGANLAGAGLRHSFAHGTTAVLIGASLLPDVDALWTLAGPAEATLGRHMLTHSLVGLVPLSLLGAAAFKLVFRDMRFAVIFGLCLLGVSLHVLMDMPVAFGVGLFAPFSDTRFEVPLVFVVDPVIWLLLGLPLVLPALGVRLGARAAQAALAGVALYFGVCGAGRILAERQLAEHIGPGSRAETLTYVLPEPLGPYRWKGISEHNGLYQEVLIHPFSGRIQELGTVLASDHSAAVSQVHGDALGRRLEAFFKLPVWRQEPEGMVLAYDLRFRYATLDNRWDPFSFRFRIGGDGIHSVDWSPREVIENSLAVARRVWRGDAP